MALVGHISGSSRSNSVIGVSGSVIIANRSAALFPALPGTDVSFFVSGSSASDMALFGGGLVSSGSVAVKNSTGVSQFSADSTGITVKDSSGVSKFTVASATGNTVVQGTFQSVGTFTATGGLTATSITGSITKLAGGGDYLIAGSNITLTTGSNGSVTIASSGGGSPGGADTQIQFNNNGSFEGDSGLTYNSTSDTLTGVTGSFYRVVAADEVRANGGSVTTTQTTFNLVNTTATTLNIGGAATAVEIGAATGTTSINNALTVDGNVTLGDASADTVTVNGTTTFAGTAVTTTLAGSGSIAGTLTVGGASTLNGNVTLGDASADTVTVNGTTTFAGSGVTTTFAGDIAVNGGDVTTTSATFNLVNGTATSVNFAGAGTDINIGAATGNLYLKNATTNVSGNITLAGDIAVNGGDITTSAATFNLVNTTATTLNVGGAATTVAVGASTGTATVNNATVTLANATTLNVNGANPTVAGTSTGTVSLFNTNLLTANAFGAATAITMGDSTTATTTIRGGTLVGNKTTQNLFNTTATTLNIGGAATTVEIGAATGTTSVNNDLTVDGNTTLGNSSSDTVTVNGTTTFVGAINSVTTFSGDIAVNGGDVTTTSTTFNLVNATATTLNIGGAATTVEIGAATGTTSVNNDLTVDGTFTAKGDITLGDANTDIITITGRCGSSFLPSADATKDLGSTARKWNGYFQTLYAEGTTSIYGDMTAYGNATFGDATTDTVTFTARAASNFLPSADVTYNLGSSTNRWANIYTGDLHLKNNRGDYTLIEEEDFLTIRFNKTGKRYKFLLEAVPELDEELGNFSS